MTSLRRNWQDYDATDLFYELADDALNFDGFREWAESGFEGISWERVENCYAWSGSVMRQWVEWACGSSEWIVDDVFDYVLDQATSHLRRFIEADNYGYMTSEEETTRVFDMYNMWIAEEVI